MNSAAPPARLLGPSTLAWAGYLGSSWTWCIGMFLPILLVRDFGAWAFVAFALPNVVGAGAMGWVLARPGASEAIVGRHRAACAAFSLVTLAFHVFFVAWFLGSFARQSNLATPLERLLPFLPAALVAGATAATLRRPANPWPGLLAYLLSLAAFILFLLAAPPSTAHPSLAPLIEPAPRPAAAPSALNLLWLTPVSVFGFALCPYLDLTFHRARRSLPGAPGTAAFSLGFGVLFFSMILFTLAYSGAFTSSHPGALAPLVVVPLTAHVLLQATYTSMLHAGELARTPSLSARGAPRATATILIAGALLVGAGALGLLAADPGLPMIARAGPLRPGEVVYRLFMSFYALVFPAYVWICMIPTRDGRSGPTRAKVLALALGVGVAAPMFFMGFLAGHPFYLAPGLAVVLLARLLVRAGSGVRRVR